MKARKTLIVISIAIISVCCTKPKLTDVNASFINKPTPDDSIKQSLVYPPSPLAGTWKLEKTSIIYETELPFLSRVNAAGNDTFFVNGINPYDQCLDSITIKNNGSFTCTCSVSSTKFSGHWSFSNALLIFDNSQVADNSSTSYVPFLFSFAYWFLQEPSGIELKLTTPYIYVPGECGDPGLLDKFELDYVMVSRPIAAPEL